AASRPGARDAALRFAPGVGPGVIGVPADELRDSRVPLAQLWPAAAARRLAERATEAAAAGGTAGAAAVLERQVATRPPAPDRRIAGIVAGLRRGASVPAVAAAAGYSERQLHRRSVAAFGYGPKTLARVLRLVRALALARAGTAFATVAATAGYADQAHLARDVKDLAGVPLSALVP
ncbi:MAG TPA: helix-turn-helix domain-containing protein, partial [Pilimelia sp.]|nr:helix-turn-helix domain-containing protein [Pilimelia sp.]